jgi:hypothetical protein
MDPGTIPILEPLTAAAAWEYLDWDGYPFSYPEMVRIRTLPGGGALLHAVFNAYFVPYRSNRFTHASEAVERRDLVNKYREYLAKRLGEKVEPDKINSPTIHRTLAGGKMHYYSEIRREYKLEVMQSELCDPDFFIDDKYLELIANELDKDIYILDSVTRDVVVFETVDPSMYYRGRPSIVLLYLPAGHFELVGIHRPNDDACTHFAPDAPFIEALYRRYMERLDEVAAEAAAE